MLSLSNASVNTVQVFDFVSHNLTPEHVAVPEWNRRRENYTEGANGSSHPANGASRLSSSG